MNVITAESTFKGSPVQEEDLPKLRAHIATLSSRSSHSTAKTSGEDDDMVTLRDERFHNYKGQWYPRCTWVLETGYPKDKFFYEWLMKNGANAETIKTEAGERGTRVHHGIEDLLNGTMLTYDAYNEVEWSKLMAFVRWYEAKKPVVIATELPVFHKKYKIVGTLDAILWVDGKLMVVDWKTSNTYQESYQVQTAFYADALFHMTGIKVASTAILRLGTKHKCGYEWTERNYTEMEEDMATFKACKQIFDYKVGECTPHMPQVPYSLILESL